MWLSHAVGEFNNLGLRKIGRRRQNGMGHVAADGERFYNPQINEIVFRPHFAAPLLHASRRRLTTAQGSVIGHEMTHGFDDQGARLAPRQPRQLVERGGFEKLQERAKCIIDQFSAFEVERA